MKEYIILSLKHGTAKKPIFWRANDKGYTYSPFAAGRYFEEDIIKHSEYYNNGESTVAVELSDQALESIGFKCSYDNSKVAAHSSHPNPTTQEHVK